MGAGKLLWGWHPATKTWIPLQVDINGKVVVDMSAISLGDLGDVRVPAPADQNFLYWDATAGEWTYRILVDADIPAGIARDAEVASAVADEATARVADVDAEEAARITADTDHAALTTGVHGAASNEDILVAALNRSNFTMIPVNAGWTTTEVNSGVLTQQPLRIVAHTGVTANSEASGYARAYGFNEDGNYNYLNWDKRLSLIFNLGRVIPDTEVIARVQLKLATTEGALGAKGIGLKVANFALWGESYGTGLGEVDLETSSIEAHGNQIRVDLDPGVSVKWYMNGTLIGTQATAAKIPTGITASATYFVVSIINGATGGADAYLTFMQPKIWQAR